ncbi:MAG: hypothetical protein ACJ75L_10555 [Gaiellaceae bacterium]
MERQDLAGATTATLRDLLDRAGRGESVRETVGVEVLLVQQELEGRTGEAEARKRADDSLTDAEREQLNQLQLMCPGISASRVTDEDLARLSPRYRGYVKQALGLERRFRGRLTLYRRAVTVEKRAVGPVRPVAALRRTRRRERRATTRRAARAGPAGRARPRDPDRALVGTGGRR